MCAGAEFKLFSAGEVNCSSGQSRHVTAGARSWKIGSVVMFICSDKTFYGTAMQLFPRLLECIYSLFLPFRYFFKEALSEKLYIILIFIVVVVNELQASVTD